MIHDVANWAGQGCQMHMEIPPFLAHIFPFCEPPTSGFVSKSAGGPKLMSMILGEQQLVVRNLDVLISPYCALLICQHTFYIYSETCILTKGNPEFKLFAIFWICVNGVYMHSVTSIKHFSSL